MAQQPVIIVNTAASKAQRLLPHLRAQLKTQAPSHPVHLVTGRQVISYIERGLKADATHFIVAGGDGTINAATNALVGKDATLGIIPLGTSNDSARGLGIPFDPAAALQVALQGQPRSVVVGQVNDHFFLNDVVVGLPAMAVRETASELKRALGTAAYFVRGIMNARQHEPFHCNITTLNEEVSLTTRHLVVANGSFHAGRDIRVLTSAAEADLVIMAIGTKPGLLHYAGQFARFVTSPLITRTNIFSLRTSQASISFSAAQTVIADGERIKSTNLSLSCNKGKLRIMLPT